MKECGRSIRRWNPSIASTRESWNPEIHRIRGEFHRLEPDDRAAEPQFREALQIARGQEAKGWELRAANSLTRLMLDQGRHDEARAIIEPIYGWFTEGFASGDLGEAKSLLDEALSRSG